MIGLRKVFGFLTVAAFALFAVPATANWYSNTFTLVMSPSLSSGVPSQVTAKITNTDCDHIRSFKLTVPSGVTVTAATAPGVAPSNISISGGVVSVRNVNLANGQSLTVTLTVTFAGSANCSVAAYAWAGQGWENSNFTGDRFVTDKYSKLNTNISGLCNYGFTVAPGSAARGATSPLTATLANASGSTSPITTATITAPAGYVITAATPTTGTVATALPAGSITISSLSLAGGASVGVALQVSVPCGAASTGNTWASAVNAGFTATTPVQSTDATGACSLGLAAPTSVAVNVPFSVTVALSGGAGTAPVTLQGSGCGTFTAGPTNAVGGSVTFSNLVFASTGTCTVTASAPDYTSKSQTLTAYAAGNLACEPTQSNPNANVIIGSAATGLTISNPGFAEGVRGQNIVKPGAPTCIPVNWTFTNNVLGSGNTVDAKGNTVLPNGVSFVWDQVSQPNAAYSYTVTWQPEWFSLSSASNRKTKFCTDAGCTAPTPAQACLSPALLPSSIPGTDPACVSAEVWAVVGTGCTLPAPAGQSCVIFTTTITDINDPPFVRN